MNNKKTKSTPTTQQNGISHTVALQCDILDPAPTGATLADDAMAQAVVDCAQFSSIAFLEPPSAAVVASNGKSVTLHRHRLIVVVMENHVNDVLGHLSAYCNLMFQGHPVLICSRPTAFLQ